MNDQNQLQSEPRNDCVHISRNCWDSKKISEFLFYNKISLSIYFCRSESLKNLCFLLALVLTFIGLLTVEMIAEVSLIPIELNHIIQILKAGRFQKLLDFARSHYIVTRGSVSLSCATTPHPSCFSKSYCRKKTKF